jgi:protein phosphatase
MQRFEHAVRATRGGRDYQEDAAALWPSPEGDPAEGQTAVVDGDLLVVLADGMGGHAGGAVASKTVCESFISTYSAEAEGEVPERLKRALEAANLAVAAQVTQKPHLSGMGSTLVGARFSGAGLEWVSVGDSPMFLYRDGAVAPLNADHSLAPLLDQLAKAGRMTEEEARADPRRHMLRAAVTGEPIELVDVSQKPCALLPGDYVVLASDGIHTLEGEHIARVIKAFADDGPATIATKLISEVEAQGDPHQDNTTLVVVRLLAPAG